MANENAVVEEMLTKPSMVVPTLFVGIGGCGCGIAVRVAQHLKQRPDYEERYSDLIKVALVDTNINDLETYREHADESFLISNFEKEEYANLAAGKLFLEADDYFTQWVPQDYRFRAGDTAGAGQIRIESRLGTYYQMKHKDMVPRFRRLFEQMKSHEHGHRRLDSSEIRIVMCYSTAGGTGSGSHLSLAYTLRDQARELGKPSVIAVSVQPAVFEDKTGANKDGTFANGYAALKEVEHLMKLGSPESRFYPEDGIEFHYDPSDTSKRRVNQQPFDFCYIIDKPESYSVENPIDAAADGLYLQLFSPIFNAQSGDYDNYTQHQRFLVPHDFEAKGIVGYTQFYGSYGSAVLLVPVPGLVDYCSRSAALGLMRQSFLGSIPGDQTYSQLRANSRPFYEVTEVDADDAAPIHLSDFRKKDSETRKRLRDRLFQKRVRLLAACEHGERESAQFMEIFRHGHLPGAVPTAEGGHKIDDERKQRDTENLGQAGMKYSMGAILLQAVTGERNAGLTERAYVAMDEEKKKLIEGHAYEKEDLSYWKAVVNGATRRLKGAGMGIVENGYRDPRSKALIPGMEKLVELDFMKDEAGEVNLAAQRYAALAVLDALREDDTQLHRPKPPQFDMEDDDRVDDDDFRTVLARLYDYQLKDAFYEIQKDFLNRRATFRDRLAQMAEQLRGLEAGFEEFARNQEKEVRRSRVNGDESANRYVIDTEALQIENGRRMWDFYFEDKVAPLSELSLQNKEVQRRLSGVVRMMSLQKGMGNLARLRKLFASLLDYARGFLDEHIGGDPKAQDPERRDGLRLAEALKLEAEYRALFRTNQEEIDKEGRKAIRHAVADYRARPDEDQIDLSQEVYQEYFRDKIKRIEREKASLLCSYDESRDQHGGVRPNHVFLGAISEEFADPDIEAAIRSVDTAGIKWLEEGWHDPHKIIFYRAVLNVPLYVFGRMDELKEYYYRFKNMAKRSKVLHIDKNWEDTLPDLDPDGAQEKHRQEMVRQHIINFGVLLTANDTFANNKGFITHRGGKYFLRPPNSVSANEGEDVALLGSSLTESIERLPDVLEAERVKYLRFQHMLTGVHEGLAPQLLNRVVTLPFRWRRNRDQLRTQYGTDPSPEQKLKLDDYTDSFERMKEALVALLDRLRNIEAEQMTIGGGLGSNSAGVTEQQARASLRQSIELLRGFVDGWRALENPEESRTVPRDFQNLFQPMQEDQLKDTLEILRSGEIDRASFESTSAQDSQTFARSEFDGGSPTDDE
ncbi:MAG: tubulin-like doman-containing protein [Persicimonas sp.]